MGQLKKQKKCKRLSKCASPLLYSPCHLPSAFPLMIKQWENLSVRGKQEWQLKNIESTARQLTWASLRTNSQSALLDVRLYLMRMNAGCVNRNHADNKPSAISKVSV